MKSWGSWELWTCWAQGLKGSFIIISPSLAYGKRTNTLQFFASASNEWLSPSVKISALKRTRGWARPTLNPKPSLKILNDFFYLFQS
jgi:hypothetical protein